MSMKLIIVIGIFATVIFHAANGGAGNCDLIRDSDKRNYCRAVSEKKKPIYCESIRDSDLRHYCRAIANDRPIYCESIREKDMRNMCRAVLDKD